MRELCLRFGIADRIPRPIIPGDRRHANKRLVEWLANQAYALELEGAASSRVWTYRKAAWAIEELEQDVRRVRSELGLHGLESIPGVGAELGSEIDRFLASLAPSPMPPGSPPLGDTPRTRRELAAAKQRDVGLHHDRG